MNDVFGDMLDICVVVYIHNILIYSDNPSQHGEHVHAVLQCLQLHSLYAKVDKCEWHRDSVEFLGYMLYADGLTRSEDKIQTIRDWPEPWKGKDIQSFLGFASFYRCVIVSDITVPLTQRTWTGIPWAFTEDCRKSFKFLKKAFTSAPILSHWVPDQPLVVETDASDYALGAILSTFDASGELHPVMFPYRTFSGAEINYDVHDKELLAIFEAFKRWQHYLEGSALPIDIVTDHKNLEYFSTNK
jgi:RNase H-like domain found in reverse transcriptase/Reverse transcriptase (RNA-dependent DNA polymerase)